MSGKEYISIAEFAKFIGISRIAVYKKIKNGQIKAVRIGRSYAILRKYLPDVIGHTLEKAEMNEIRAAVKKVMHDYGETLQLLGKE
jgi:excisionase family DNA binding protein